MEGKNKTIELIGLKKTRPILGFVRHHVESWIEREQSLMFFPKTSSYHVTVTHDLSAPGYSCRIEICIGSKRWFGFESGKTLQDTLSRTLRHLRSDSLVVLPKIQAELTV